MFSVLIQNGETGNLEIERVSSEPRAGIGGNRSLIEHNWKSGRHLEWRMRWDAEEGETFLGTGQSSAAIKIRSTPSKHGSGCRNPIQSAAAVCDLPYRQRYRRLAYMTRSPTLKAMSSMPASLKLKVREGMRHLAA